MSTKVIVDGISTKMVTTKFGSKPTFSFKGNDGQWYSLGFKKPQFNKGDEVEFDFESTKYGNQVTAILSQPFGDGTVAAPDAPAPRKTFGGGGGGFSRGVFPIPPTDGQRSIIRQNSLTNALKMFEVVSGGAPAPISVEDVLKVARQFESYSAGDQEAMKAKKELEAKE